MTHKSRVFAENIHTFNLHITSFYFGIRWAYKIFIVVMWQHVENVSEILLFFFVFYPPPRDAVSTLSVRHLHRLIKCEVKRWKRRNSSWPDAYSPASILITVTSTYTIHTITTEHNTCFLFHLFCFVSFRFVFSSCFFSVSYCLLSQQ